MMLRKINLNASVDMVRTALEEYQNSLLTTREIAKKYGINLTTLTHWAKKNGLPLRGRGRHKAVEPAPRQAEIIRQARIYGYAQVARRFNISRQAVHQLVHRWNERGHIKKPPFSSGDLIIYEGNRMIVIDADIKGGRLKDEKTGAVHEVQWSKDIMPRKIGRITQPEHT